MSYNFALIALHSMTPAASIWSISDGLKPNSCSTSTVCSPIAGSRATPGSAGVLESTGAGRGLSCPLASSIKEALSRLCGCELTSSKDSTGVTQASVPSKIFDHSVWVFEAKRSAKIFVSSGQSLMLIWSGNSAASRSKPTRKTDSGEVFFPSPKSQLQQFPLHRHRTYRPGAILPVPTRASLFFTL